MNYATEMIHKHSKAMVIGPVIAFPLFSKGSPFEKTTPLGQDHQLSADQLKR